MMLKTNMTYYVVVVDGVPLDVSQNYAKALQSMRELETKNRVAVVIPCIPMPEPFDSEVPTDPQMELPFDSPSCSCNYEVGYGWVHRCETHKE
jgi:hypothetical protein